MDKPNTGGCFCQLYASEFYILDVFGAIIYTFLMNNPVLVMHCLVYVAETVKSTRTILQTSRGWKKRGEKRVNLAVQRHLITLRERLSGIAPSIHLFPSFALSHSSTKRFSCPVCNPHPLYLPVIPPSSHPSHSLRTVKDKSDDKRLS